jgi:predicted nucleic acid-binding protein
MILIDTGPLVALCDPRDGLHARAATDLRKLAGRSLVTCEAVLVEACFHLLHPIQRARLRAVIDELEITVASTHAPTFHDQVFDWLAKYADHDPDWADACLAVLSGQDRELRVWTYDREFRTTWRRLDRTAIPLAIRS